MEPSPFTDTILPLSAVLIAGATSAVFLVKPLRYLKYTKIKTQEQLRGLSSKQFEEYIVFSFKKLGYVAEVIGRTEDGVVGVLLTKNGKQQVVQCDAWTGRRVPCKEVRDGFVFTSWNSYYIRSQAFTLDGETVDYSAA
jgi:hypothetical protein